MNTEVERLDGLAFLQAVPQPLLIVSTNGIILHANDAAVDELCYTGADDLIGRSSHSTLHPYHPDGSVFPEHDCLMLRPAITGERERGEDYWFTRRDGSTFPISWWSSPLNLPSGPAIAMSFTDVTERLRLSILETEQAAARARQEESRASQRRLIDTTTAIRRQTARDLHDGAQQRLVSIAILLRLAGDQAGDPAQQTLILQAGEQAKQAIKELRDLAAGVYPTVLTAHGLNAALRQLTDRSPVPLTVRTDIPERPATQVDINAYFIAAEAVTNAIKHAHARSIIVTVTEADMLTLDVSDDGDGGVAPDSFGSGLHGIRDRAAVLGGRLTVTSPRGKGTTIHVSIPI